MMLDHLGERSAAQAVNAAVERVLSAGEVATPDLGGKSTTADLGTAVAAALVHL